MKLDLVNGADWGTAHDIVDRNFQRIEQEIGANLVTTINTIITTGAGDLVNYFFLPGRSGGQVGYGGILATEGYRLYANQVTATAFDFLQGGFTASYLSGGTNKSVSLNVGSGSSGAILQITDSSSYSLGNSLVCDINATYGGTTANPFFRVRTGSTNLLVVYPPLLGGISLLSSVNINNGYSFAAAGYLVKITNTQFNCWNLELRTSANQSADALLVVDSLANTRASLTKEGYYILGGPTWGYSWKIWVRPGVPYPENELLGFSGTTGYSVFRSTNGGSDSFGTFRFDSSTVFESRVDIQCGLGATIGGIFTVSDYNNNPSGAEALLSLNRTTSSDASRLFLQCLLDTGSRTTVAKIDKVGKLFVTETEIRYAPSINSSGWALTVYDDTSVMRAFVDSWGSAGFANFSIDNYGATYSTHVTFYMINSGTQNVAYALKYPETYTTGFIYVTFSSNVGTLSFLSPSTDDIPEGSNLYYTDERVDARVAALLVAGTNITLTYSDIANTLTIDAAGGVSTHTLLNSAVHTDTTTGTVVRGDIITGQTATPKWTRLALGGANTVLVSNGTDIVYSNTFTFTPVWNGLHTFNPSSTSQNVILLDMSGGGSYTTRPSHWIQFRTREGIFGPTAYDWRMFVDVATTPSSTFKVGMRVSTVGAFTELFQLKNNGLITVTNKITGLTQATAATDAVAGGRNVTTGTALTGGGDLTADRTISFDTTAGLTITGPWIFESTADVVSLTAVGYSGSTQPIFTVKDYLGTEHFRVAYTGAVSLSTGGTGFLRIGINAYDDIGVSLDIGGISSGVTLTVPDSSGVLVLTSGAQALTNKTLKVNISGSSTACYWADSTTVTKRLYIVLSGAVGNNDFTFIGNARSYTFPDQEGYVTIKAVPVKLVNQTATITATTFYTARSSQLLYISVGVRCSSAGTGGTVTVVARWTDANGSAKAVSTGAVNLNALSDTIVAGTLGNVEATGTITYEATVSGATGSPKFSLWAGAAVIC